MAPYTLDDAVAYELQVVDHLQHGHARVYHWLDVPESVLYSAGWFTDHSSRRRRMLKSGKFLDLGLDAVCVNADGTYTGVQAKCYGGTSSLTTSKLATFLVSTSFYLQEKNPRNKGLLVHTPEARFEDDVKHTYDTVLAKRGFSRLSFPFDGSPQFCQECQDCQDLSTLELRRYQKQCIDAVCASSSKLKLIVLPCGSGKTEIVKRCLQRNPPNVVVLAAPLRYSAEQNMDRIKPGLPDHEPVVAFSGKTDTCLDETVIKEKLDSGNKLFITTTFASLDLVMRCVGDSGDVGEVKVVIDESHNLANENQLWDHIQERDTLLVTATPPSFMIEENPDIDLVFHYQFAKAIQDGHILDYEIVVPDVTHSDNLPEEVPCQDSELCAKVLFLISGMLEKGCKKTIVYLSSQEECHQFNNLFRTACKDYFGLDANVAAITCDTSDVQRKINIQKFAAPNFGSRDVNILTSVRILDEAIDIPECDSVFFAHVADRVTDRASTRAVQRLCRANRILPRKTKATAFVWTGSDDENDLTATFSILKENDPEFMNKISVVSRNYDSKGSEESKKMRDDALEIVRNSSIFKLSFADKIWEEKYNAFVEYVTENKVLPKQGENYNGKAIGSWIHNQRTFYSYGKLSAYRIRKLEEIQIWQWITRNKKRNRVDDIVNFFAKNKRLPSDKDSYEGSKFGNSIYAVRYKYRDNTLSDEDKARLESLPGWSWGVRDKNKTVDEFIEVASRFYDTHMRHIVPRTDSTFEDYPLADRARYIRQLYKEKKLSKEHIDKLESLEFWSFDGKASRSDKWMECYNITKEHFQLFGKRIPVGSIYKGVSGNWFGNQVVFFNKGNTLEWKVQLLRQLPVVGSIFE